MISAERLREVIAALESDVSAREVAVGGPAKFALDLAREKLSVYRELEAARSRIAELINEVAAHHFVRNERDRLLGQLRAQGLSQEDRERMSDAQLFAALVEHKIDLTQSGPSWWATSSKLPNFEKGECPRSAIANCVAAILRRLGGQTT